MVPMNWNLPPGTPTGTQRDHFVVWCKGCHEQVEVTQVYERDTNAGWLEPEDGCPNCGHEWEDDALDSAERYEPEPPEPDFFPEPDDPY
jgi:rRNA maturation endonuclease Nob1